MKLFEFLRKMKNEYVRITLILDSGKTVLSYPRPSSIPEDDERFDKNTNISRFEIKPGEIVIACSNPKPRKKKETV